MGDFPTETEPGPPGRDEDGETEGGVWGGVYRGPPGPAGKDEGDREGEPTLPERGGRGCLRAARPSARPDGRERGGGEGADEGEGAGPGRLARPLSSGGRPGSP